MALRPERQNLHKVKLSSNHSEIYCNFRDNRAMKISSKEKISEYFSKRAGVHQCSVLSPTLYILSVNDMPDPVQQDTLMIPSAEGVTHVTRAGTLYTLTTKIQQELDSISRWELCWDHTPAIKET